jgi:hypothetical protein
MIQPSSAKPIAASNRLAQGFPPEPGMRIGEDPHRPGTVTAFAPHSFS